MAHPGRWLDWVIANKGVPLGQCSKVPEHPAGQFGPKLSTFQHVFTTIEMLGFAWMAYHQGLLEYKKPYIRLNVRQVGRRIHERFFRLRPFDLTRKQKLIFFSASFGSAALNLCLGTASKMLFLTYPDNFDFELKPSSWINAAASCMFTFLTPGVTEEGLFRAMLLRLPDECEKGGRPPVIEQIANVLLFMCWHLDVWHSNPVFRDPRFMLIVAILGASCQELVIRINLGWPVVIIHWLTVWVWLIFCGGFCWFWISALAGGGV